MMKIAFTALALAAFAVPQSAVPAQAAGITTSHTLEISAAKRRTAKKKPKFSRAHCAKLNQEKARLYGICGY